MMRNGVKIFIITAGTALLLSGCGGGAVKCDDSDAQKTVMTISGDTLKDQLARMYTIYTYQQLHEIAKEKPELNQYIEKVDSQYRDSAPTLMNIRTNAVDDNLKKSECAAEIGFANGNTLPITYKLSKTSEDKLYVEVLGL